MNLSSFIARRYLFSKKLSAINIISGVAVLAFTVCTAALIIILSAMNGFENLFFSMYSRFNPDFKITAVHGKVFEGEGIRKKILKIEGVSGVWNVLEDNVAIRNENYQSVCTVKGVDPDYLIRNDIDALITEGDATLKQNDINYMVMGALVYQKVNADIEGPFSVLSLISPRRGEYSVNDPDAVRTMQIHASGVLTGDESLSSKYVFVPFSFAEELFERKGKVSSLEVRMKPGADEEKIHDALTALCGNSLKIQNRLEQQASLFKMFRSEKWASFAILSFILLIAAFNALGSLTMLVIEKKEDIKTLSMMGASKKMIRNIYLTNGFLISGMGALIGLILGIALVMAQQKFGLVKMTGAIIENYPVELLGSDVVLVASTAIGLGLLTGLYPALKSVKDLR